MNKKMSENLLGLAHCKKQSAMNGSLQKLKEEYGIPVGFIDHTPYKWMPSCAVISGADIVSKHMTWSRDAKGPDWKICLEPNEMKYAVEQVRKIEKSIQTNHKCLAPGEYLDRSIMRRSIVASVDIPKGKPIVYDDICFKRPGTGIEPKKLDMVIGKRTKREIKSGELITFAGLQ